MTEDAMTKKGQPSDDVSSAPESGTVRDETSGNNPSNRTNRPDSPADRAGLQPTNSQNKDDPFVANEEL
jgi:hypothetical protein